MAFATTTVITFCKTSVQHNTCSELQSEAMGTFFKNCEEHERQRFVTSAEKSVFWNFLFGCRSGFVRPDVSSVLGYESDVTERWHNGGLSCAHSSSECESRLLPYFVEHAYAIVGFPSVSTDIENATDSGGLQS